MRPLLVGGLAAVAQGAPLTTVDVDVVHRRDPENVDRLLAFLASVDARHRGRPAGQGLRPAREALLGPGHQLLVTGLGPLDVLGVIEGGRDYPSLLPEALTIEVEGQPVRVVRLETLAELERNASIAKDRLVLALLEDTLRQRRGSPRSGSPGGSRRSPWHRGRWASPGPTPGAPHPAATAGRW